MINAIAVILSCQLAGEVAARGLGLPVPGPVLGFVLLLILLWLRPALAEAIGGTARGILAHLSLLFVPAGVGVVGNLDLLSRNWFPIAVVLVVSTVIAMIASVLTFLAVNRLTRGGHD